MNNPKCLVSTRMEMNTICNRKFSSNKNIKINPKSDPINKKSPFNNINSKNNEKKLPKLLKVFSKINLKKSLILFIIIILSTLIKLSLTQNDFTNYINLTIIGEGKTKFLRMNNYSKFDKPSQIFINEKLVNFDRIYIECKYEYCYYYANFSKKIEENIIIEWNSKINNTYEMFYGCNSIISLNLNHFDMSNIKNISRMFYGCSSLNSLDISNFNTTSVTDMSWMFYGCSSLNSLDISKLLICQGCLVDVLL